MAKTPDNKLYNSATVFYNGNRVADYRKQHLPNYGVFDEKRYITAGDEVCVFELGNVPTALCICEDAWFPGVVETSAQHGAQAIVSVWDIAVLQLPAGRVWAWWLPQVHRQKSDV